MQDSDAKRGVSTFPVTAGRRAIIVALVIAGLAALVWLNFDRIMLAVAIGNSEDRPELLSDARWNQSASAVGFEERFVRGAPTSGLVAWLEENEFTIDAGAGRASKRIQSLPCNENVTVTWEADAAGRLINADALISEAGCL